jgi:hypothetical protein
MDQKFIMNLSGRDYPLWAGILSEAHDRGLQAIKTELIQIPGTDNDNTAIVKAIVLMKDGSVFEDFGDASPRNCSSKIANALIRMASTRAKGRALRDAVNVGQTMMEELGDLDDAGSDRMLAPPIEYRCANKECQKPLDEQQAITTHTKHQMPMCAGCETIYLKNKKKKAEEARKAA